MKKRPPPVFSAENLPGFSHPHYNDYMIAKRRKAFRRAALLLSAAVMLLRQIFIAMSIARMIQRIILCKTIRFAEKTIEKSIVFSMR